MTKLNWTFVVCIAASFTMNIILFVSANAWVNTQTKQMARLAPMIEYVESIESAYQRHNIRYNFLNPEGNQGPYIPHETLMHLNERLADNLKRSLEYARSRYLAQQITNE